MNRWVGQTLTFEVVFPKGLEEAANRSANELETFYGPMSDSFGVRPKRVTVILDNQGPTLSIGGYVNNAPLRSVWYTPPSQGSIGTNPWLTLMAAHEGRHLIQFRAMNRGFTRGASTLFGDTGLNMMRGWSLPMWWLEGDAMVAESRFTAGGQGRLPEWSLLTRTNVLAKRRFSYMKAMHGSYNEVLPSSYEMGSFIISRVNRTAGIDAWNRILGRWARNSWNPFSLSRAIRKETGRSAPDTYAEAVSEAGELWEAKADYIRYTASRTLNQKPKTVWTSYLFPVYEPGGSVLARKSGLADVTGLVRIHPDGSEQLLFHYAPGGNTRVSVAGTRMVWDEHVPDPRWIRGWSDIVIHDLATGRRRHLTHHTRLESPAFSPDGARIAAIEYTASGVCSVVILDSATGAAKRFPAASAEFLSTPAWSTEPARLPSCGRPQME